MSPSRNGSRPRYALDSTTRTRALMTVGIASFRRGRGLVAASIIAAACGGGDGNARIVNAPVVVSVTVTPATVPPVDVGGTFTLTADVQVQNGASTAVTWSSSAPNVATVSQSGRRHGRGLGSGDDHRYVPPEFEQERAFHHGQRARRRLRHGGPGERSAPRRRRHRHAQRCRSGPERCPDGRRVGLERA